MFMDFENVHQNTAVSAKMFVFHKIRLAYFFQCHCMLVKHFND